MTTIDHEEKDCLKNTTMDSDIDIQEVRIESAINSLTLNNPMKLEGDLTCTIPCKGAKTFHLI